MNEKIKNKVVNIKSFGTSCLRGRGFTLIELVVAITLMAIIVVFAGSVFKVAIGSYRIASGQAEIMQKFRAITDQLNNDFRGLRKDAPLFIWFQLDPNDYNKRLDQIMFFADGDFQSIQTYDNNPMVPSGSGSPVFSNLARIYYGHAQSIDPRDNVMKLPSDPCASDRLLSRRQHLLIANPDPPEIPYAIFPAINPIDGSINITPLENQFEHDTNSISEWITALQNLLNVQNVITGSFGTPATFYNDYRPPINRSNSSTLHLLMAEKVGSFGIQWNYNYIDTSVVPPVKHIYWWPSIDADGSGNIMKNDFLGPNPLLSMGLKQFGFYFNTADPPAPVNTSWFPYSGGKGFYYPDAVNPINTGLKPSYPTALKFTFTLYDSRGVFKDGQTFTHIIYLGD